MNPVDVRVATQDDVRFVASTWFRAVLESGAALNQLPFAVVRDGLDSHIKRLLAKSTTRVAFATDTPDEILGYVVLEQTRDWTPRTPGEGFTRQPVDTCHHTYVKKLYRRQGIARSLIGAVKTYTHPATPGSGKLFATALGLTYNPRLA